MRRQWTVIGSLVVVFILVFIGAATFVSPPVDQPLATAPAIPRTSGGAPASKAPLLVRAGQPSITEAASDATYPFAFMRVVVDTSGDLPEACLRFNRPLDARPETHYGDYLKIEPAAATAVRIAITDLCVSGLVYGTDYKVTLAAGLPAQSGARVDRAQSLDISLGDRPPLVAISGDGYILPRDSSHGLTIATVNVDRLKIHVLRMSERLLATRLRSTSEYADNAVLAQVSLSRYQLRDFLAREAALVWSGEMTVLPDHNRTVETAFPLRQIIKPGDIGAYLVVAENAAKALPASFWDRAMSGDASHEEDFTGAWQPDIAAHWAIATDIALTAMTGADGLHIFARSLATAEPLPGLPLALIALGQDQLGEGVTDAGGVAQFAPGLLRGKGAATAAAVIAYGAQGDFAVLDLRRAAFDLSDRGVSGRPAPGPAEAFLYTERGIYRPGETVNVMALLRDHEGAAFENTPMTLMLRRPDGVEVQRFALAGAPQGGSHQAIALSKTASFGLWSVEAVVDPASPPVGRVQFDVQDFVPQMLKVVTKSDMTVLHPKEPVTVRVEGRFLYGAPAAGLHGEGELRIIRDPAPVADASGYSFGLIDEKVVDATQPLAMADADGEGHSRIEDIVLPAALPAAPVKAVISAGFFEPSGRFVKDEVELPIRTQPLLIGVKPRFADNRAEEGHDAVIDIRAFDEAGHAVARQGLHWSLVREDRLFDWFEMEGAWRWHYHSVDEPVASGSIDVTAGAPAALSQRLDWGQYRLVVDDPETKAATSIRFSAGWGAASEAADTPDKVAVSVERAAYAPGETARLHIDAPFAGKAELTIAGDRIFDTRAIDLPKDGTTLEVKASPAWGNGAYAIVSLYRPLGAGATRDPVRAVGLAWIGIDTRPKTLSVAIAVPERALPRQPVTATVKIGGAAAGEPTWLTVAAVDEGILQLTRFSSPDPDEFFFGKRRLGIDIRDDYGRLLDGSATPGAIREGGDAAVGGRELEVTSTRTVALFAGPVSVSPDGTAQVTLDIPDFEGQLRLMAVAYNHDAVGHGGSSLIIRDPVIADLSLPRFLAPGDTARLALNIHDTDGAAGAYHLDLAATGAVRLSIDHPLDYQLGVGEQRYDAVTIEGLDQGIGTIAADLSGPDNYKVHREWQIAVRAAHYPITIETTQRQAPGESFTLDARVLDAFVPGSTSVSVGYSGFAGIDVASLLQSLYRYPYGCTEQLVSTSFPLLYFNDPVLLGRAPQDEGVKDRIARIIATLMDRQDASGEFGLWRANDGEASVWLNVYAVDFLLRARDAGFEVPEAGMQRGFTWLSETLRQLDQENGGAYAEGPQATRAYALYVMARAGRVEPGQIRYAHDTIEATRLASGGFMPASIYWRADRRADSLAQAMSLGQLGGALSLMGDRARARDAFAMSLANLGIRNYPHWWFSYSYYSEIQDAAGLLAVAAEVGDTGVAEQARERLVALAPAAEELNTQEKAWILAAAHALNRDERARSLSVNGRAVENLRLPTAFAPTIDEVRYGYAVANTSARDLWRTVVLRGSPKMAPSAIEVGYTLEKEYFALDGTPLDPSRLRQNDRFIVSLKGENKDHERHQTVIADPLPAGWEIEGPVSQPRRRSGTSPAYAEQAFAFLGTLSTPQMVEARDDRYVAAFTLGRDLSRRYGPYYFNEGPELPDNMFHLAYIVRVVTPGSFTLPEAVVEDMYRPGVMARTAAGTTIAAPR